LRATPWGWIIPGALLSGISPSDSERGAEDRSPDRAIRDAAKRGDLNSVRRLHQSGADLRLHDDALLCAACEGGSLDIVRYLHENGVALNAPNQEPLCRACAPGHLHIVRYLHENGVGLNAPNQEPLCRACAHGHLDIVRYLRENGVRFIPLYNEPLCQACDGGHLDVVRYLHEHGMSLTEAGNDALRRAAAAGHLELVRFIHQNGGDISARDNEPLRRAAAGEHSTVVQYLHKAGAATNLLTPTGRLAIEQMKQELRAAPTLDQPSAFWADMGEVNERVLGWSGEGNFKRTLNQNYFNFVPTAPDDARMTRMRRLALHCRNNASEQYVVEDPDRDPTSWMTFYPDYYIFKEPDRAMRRELYREYLELMYRYAMERDNSGLIATLEEPKLGNPIRAYRNGKLISQDLVNSVRERNSILAAMEAERDTRLTVAELGAGYGRLGYLMLMTTNSRYFVFDIPPALYVSQWYLATLFPERRVFRFRRFKKFEEIEHELSGADIGFFTSNQLAKFPAGYFDLFATISSIHEMRRDQIRHYMTQMGRTTRSVLYLKQQKDYVNPVDNLVIGKDDYPVPDGWVPGEERFDMINPGFFERVYRRRSNAA
jgi:putative sugar O-methyltransferase